MYGRIWALGSGSATGIVVEQGGWKPYVGNENTFGCKASICGEYISAG